MREIRLRQLLRLFETLNAVGGKAPRGVDDLVASAVIDADVRLKALIMGGNFIGALDEPPQLRADGAKLAENFQPDMVGLHLVDGLVQVFFKQAHDGLHLVRRALPVFRGEGVDRQILHADVLAVGRDAAEGLAAGRVTGSARKAALLCPAAIAVHNDGDVARRRKDFVFL